MFVAVVAALVVLIFIAAFVAPRLSRRPQAEIDQTLNSAASAARETPGRAGRWLAKPFTKSRRATDKSASAGRKSRSKLPF